MYLWCVVAAWLAVLMSGVLTLEVWVVVGIVVAIIVAVVVVMYLAWALRWALSLTPWAQGVFEAGSPHWIPVALYRGLRLSWCTFTSWRIVQFTWAAFKDVFQSVGGYLVTRLNTFVTLFIISGAGIALLGVPVIVGVRLSQESAAFAERTWVTHNQGIVRSIQVGRPTMVRSHCLCSCTALPSQSGGVRVA